MSHDVVRLQQVPLRMTRLRGRPEGRARGGISVSLWRPRRPTRSLIPWAAVGPAPWCGTTAFGRPTLAESAAIVVVARGSPSEGIIPAGHGPSSADALVTARRCDSRQEPFQKRVDLEGARVVVVVIDLRANPVCSKPADRRDEPIQPLALRGVSLLALVTDPGEPLGFRLLEFSVPECLNGVSEHPSWVDW